MRIEDDPETRPSWAVLLIVPIVIGAVGGALVGVVVMVIEDWLLGDLVLGLPGLWFALPAVGVFVLTRLALVKAPRRQRPARLSSTRRTTTRLTDAIQSGRRLVDCYPVRPQSASVVRKALSPNPC